MQITLRKANELSLLAAAAAAKIELVTSVSLSVHEGLGPVDVQAALERANAELADALEKRLSLIAVGLHIRHLKGHANAAAGINDLIAKKVELEAREKLISTLLTKLALQIRLRKENDPMIVAAKLMNMKKKVENPPPPNAYGSETVPPEELDVNIGTEAGAQKLKDMLADLALHKVAVQDMITELNITTRIELDGATVKLLRDNKLLS